jgi:hypothetical protein
MKAKVKLVLILIMLSGLALMAAVPAQEPGGDRIVMGGVFTLEDGETLTGNLFVFGGVASLEEGSLVEGGVMLFGGTLTVNGTVEGDINVFGGLVDLGETAVVKGDVNSIGGPVNQEEGAQVEGSVNTGLTSPIPLVLTGRFQIPRLEGRLPLVIPPNIPVPIMDITVNPLVSGLWILFRSFLWAVVAVLVVLFMPNHTRRAAQAAVTQPLGSGGLGCLTLVVAPPVLILLVITICGIPVSLLGALLLVVMLAFGVIVLGRETGERIAGMFKQDWAPALSAGVGTFALTLVANGLAELIPCVGWLIPVILGMVGLGAVLLTRFGTQDYPAYATVTSSPVPAASYLEPATPPEPGITPSAEGEAGEDKE